ncbi:BRCA1-A complex subunit RAP80 [Limanda limanda]|uniref:BRCA1-A complex subunit RAP80 n=1 Tax=Limanda limanda TaxID=27771 RepID=UPI0029C7C5CB|nr:BRCA1-A complex subunit RAP80 [Limanda limanda]
MSVRKHIVQEMTNVPTEIISDDDTQELEAEDHRDGKDEFSSSLPSSSSARNTRRRERENQSQPKEMTEEEMMDLALRLSEQEASHTALQLQREEEAMMKAIQESKQNRLHGSRFINRHGPGSKRPLPSEPALNMVVQSQPGSPSQSQSPPAHALLRRRPPCSNGTRPPPIDQEVSRDVCTPEIDLTQETKRAGEEIKNRNKKRKRKEGVPLETSGVSQTTESQASPGGSEPLDSLSLLHKSPVFLSADVRALVHVPRLSQDLLETCRSSGFVLCSQDTSASPQTSAQPKSPTFPRSPGNLASCPRSPASLQEEDEEETQRTQSPEFLTSPVFGRNSPPETSPRACRPLLRVCETSSSEESVTSSVRTTPARHQSPAFPRSHAPPPERSPICGSPVFSAEPGHGPSPSPVFGRNHRREVGDDEPKTSVVPSEVERSNSEVSRAVGEESSQRPTQRCSSEPHQEDARWTRTPVASLSEGSQETPADLNPAETELTSDMTLLWSDKDEDVTPTGSPSPVFPEERGAGRAEVRVSSLNHDSADSPGAERRNSSAERQPGGSGGAGAPPAVGPTVQYHWGVPFCPRGLDPDRYTQVILAQMDVYNTSLKRAQRRLLRKAPWGGAILPQPEKSPSPESFADSPPRVVLRRRGLRLKKTNESEESPPAEEEEEGGEQRDEEEAEKQKSEGGEEERMDTDDCDVCPETQLSNNDDEETQDLTTDAGAELRPEGPELPEVQMIPGEDPPAAVEPTPREHKDEMEVDVCGSKEGNIPVAGAGRPPQREEEDLEDGVDPDVEETKVQRLVEPGAPPPRPEASVACPMCQGSFPVTRIERHAAFCDGDVSVLDEREPGVSSKPRRKRRRAEVPEAEETSDSASSSRNQEKCFLCQKKFSLREYTRHTELCLQRRTQKSESRGNLLSALEQTESRGSEAGPSGTRVQPAEVIDLRDEDDDEEEEEEDGVRALRVSSSPIRSFTPISEATGCLIDFRRQQRAKKPSHRRR